MSCDCNLRLGSARCDQIAHQDHRTFSRGLASGPHNLAPVGPIRYRDKSTNFALDLVTNLDSWGMVWAES